MAENNGNVVDPKLLPLAKAVKELLENRLKDFQPGAQTVSVPLSIPAPQVHVPPPLVTTPVNVDLAPVALAITDAIQAVTDKFAASVAEITKLFISSQRESQGIMARMISALENLKIPPAQVNVPAPVVNLKHPKKKMTNVRREKDGRILETETNYEY
jgi:hypothetical protein